MCRCQVLALVTAMDETGPTFGSWDTRHMATGSGTGSGTSVQCPSLDQCILVRVVILLSIHPPIIHPSIHSFTHPSTCHSSTHLPSISSPTYSSTHLSIHISILHILNYPPLPCIHLPVHTHIYPHAHLFIHPFIHHLPNHPFTHSFTHPSSHPLIYPPTHHPCFYASAHPPSHHLSTAHLSIHQPIIHEPTSPTPLSLDRVLSSPSQAWLLTHLMPCLGHYVLMSDGRGKGPTSVHILMVTRV